MHMVLKRHNVSSIKLRPDPTRELHPGQIFLSDSLYASDHAHNCQEIDGSTPTITYLQQLYPHRMPRKIHQI